MSGFSWRNGFALGLVVGICVAVLALLALSVSTEPHTPHIQWARRLFSVEDTIAQWAMTVLSLAATVLLWRTLTAANKTNEAALEANDIMRREQRPWLDFHDLDLGRWNVGSLNEDGGTATCFPKVRIINEGRSPVLETRFALRVCMGGNLDDFSIPDMVAEAATRPTEARIVFPGKEIVWDSWNAGGALPREYGSREVINWWLIGIVTYQFEGKTFSTVKIYRCPAPKPSSVQTGERGWRFLTVEPKHQRGHDRYT
jgi:hypothetical protein